MTLSQERQAGVESEPSPREEMIRGVAQCLAEWDRGDDLNREGAEKIVSWVLSFKRIQEAVTESDGRPGHVLRVKRRAPQIR